MPARHLTRWQLEGINGPVVVVDVLRAFTTAAYALHAGAVSIYLVSTVAEAEHFKREHPEVLLVGEEGGRRPASFDLPNSPVAVEQADVEGRTLVQRSSAGTQGVIGARTADRLWAGSLVCASATARAVNASGLGVPAYVITGCFADQPDLTGKDDRLTAELIERARTGADLKTTSTIDQLRSTFEADRLSTLDPEHSGPADLEFASRVDCFDFAMEVVEDDTGLRIIAQSSVNDGRPARGA